MSSTGPRAPHYTLRYPEALPITAAREEILAALAAHRVIVVCGDTGSGKTTQLPKLCLEAGCGVRGMIGHTQPRRIAAQAVAARLAEELGVRVGEAVGLEVRFTDKTGPAALIKVMTDGILLNEIRRDRDLRAYDALIIDEAHERSLNIDFILGYLRRIERRRPDLKIVITSATIDPERFARHFGGAPIVQVAGRSYPVEIRYRPPADDADLATAVTAGANEVAAERLEPASIRDVLVFLPGERWIHDAERLLAREGPKGYELLPLYARLTSARQRRILTPGKAPRIVLATNIAETSLTVPRIRYVIDSGVARVSRYAARHRVQSLGVEPIARANAAQRAGRCGRLAPGVCVRLYAEQDFDSRPEFQDPEILRTSLAGVLLKLTALRLGPIEEFPFIDAPPAKAVQDAYQLLYVLGALDAERALTPEGKTMARLPVDPRLARLLAVAQRNGALREGLVIAAALSVVDPREHSPDSADAARRKHDEFADPRSDFTTFLNLWAAYRRERRGGERALRAWCKENHLSAARLREWHDVHDQLHELAQSLGWRTRKAAADYRAVHQAVLAAFVDFIAEQDEGLVYRGIRDSRAQLFPGTPLARKRPRWLVAAERVATERAYLRTVAQVNPRWALRVVPHLVRFEYDDPAWDAERGQVTAREIATLFGMRITSERRIDYGRVSAVDARRIFIADALAADDAGPREAEPKFLAHNRDLRNRLLEWEARLRKRDVYVGEHAVAALYDARLPAEVHDRASLAAWCANDANERSLRFSPAELATRDLATLPADAYPTDVVLAGQPLTLRYRLEPGADDDGATLAVPEALLGALRPEPLEWLVPGWLPEQVTALLRALPKERRRALVPLPDTVAAVLPELERARGRESLSNALAAALARRRGVALDPAALDAQALPPHLRLRIAVLGPDGAEIAHGRDLRALQRARSGARTARSAGEQSGWAQTGLKAWTCADLPDAVLVRQRPRDVALYPAFVDAGGAVDLRLLPPGPAAHEIHRRGVRRLLLAALPQQTDLIRRRLLARRDLLLAYHGIGDNTALVDDVLLASADASFELDPAPRTREQFAVCLERGRARLVDAAEELATLLGEILPLHRELKRALGAPSAARAPRVRGDLEAQLARLVGPSLLSTTPPEWRKHLPRFLRAALARWERRGQRRDAELAAQVETAEARLRNWLESLPADWPWPPAIVEYRWLVEELRVSLFAQSLGTSQPVSPQRLERAWHRALAADATATA